MGVTLCEPMWALAREVARWRLRRLLSVNGDGIILPGPVLPPSALHACKQHVRLRLRGACAVAATVQPRHRCSAHVRGLPQVGIAVGARLTLQSGLHRRRNALLS